MNRFIKEHLGIILFGMFGSILIGFMIYYTALMEIHFYENLKFNYNTCISNAMTQNDIDLCKTKKELLKDD